MDIAGRIRMVRGNLSQVKFAEKIGLSQRTIANYENGDNIPNAEVVTRISDIFGVSLDWLFGDTADGEPPEAAKPEADRNPDEAPAGKEGEKKQKIRAIAIALAIVVIAFICVWFAARNMSNEADSTQIEDMEHEEIDIPDQDESGFDFEWKD